MYEFDMDKERKVIDRLLKAGPVFRYRTLVDLLDRSEGDPDVRSARAAARDSKDMRGLISNRRRNGPPTRPEWWGPGPDAYKGLRLQPWVIKMLSEAGMSRGDEEVRRAAQVCLDMQNPGGSFGELTGIDRVHFTADVAYALASVGYGNTGDLRNAMRWLMLWLKEHWPVRFDRKADGPGRIVLEALAHFEVFVFSPLALKALRTLFEGKRSVLRAAATDDVRMGGYDGFLTWGELGFSIGWPRSWDVPYQVMAVLSASRNRDGTWGRTGPDTAETLRALKLWRGLFKTYGPAPEGFRFEPAELVGVAAASAAKTARTGRARTKSARTGPAAAAAADGEDLSAHRRHVRALKRAGLDELAAEVVGLLNKLGYQPDWRPMYEVTFRAKGASCSFKLRLEAVPAQKGQHTLVLSALGSSRKLNVKHWSRQLALESVRGKPRLQVNKPQQGQPGQVRLVLDNAQRKVMPRLKAFLTQLSTAGGSSGAAADRSREVAGARATAKRSRRRRPRGGKR